MLPLNWGIITLAKQTGVPIIPLIMKYHPDCCYTKFGAPIYINQDMDKQEGIELLEEEMIQNRVVAYPKFDLEYEMSVVRGREV